MSHPLLTPSAAAPADFAVAQASLHDTGAGGASVYAYCGYTRVSAIPAHAADPDGPLIDMTCYDKPLTPIRPGEHRLAAAP